MSDITHHTDYRQALAAIKQRIQSSQTRAVLAVNAELLALYWDIGRQLDAWQRERAWGSAVVEQMALDLQASYPGIKGFSRTSLFAMRQFYAFFSPQFEVVPQPVGRLPILVEFNFCFGLHKAISGVQPLHKTHKLRCRIYKSSIKSTSY